jgi:hypothetical protein
MPQEIEFRISPKGEVTFETFGIEGQETCSKVKQEVMQTLSMGADIDTLEDSKKPEFWKDGSKVFTRV